MCPDPCYSEGVRESEERIHPTGYRKLRGKSHLYGLIQCLIDIKVKQVETVFFEQRDRIWNLNTLKQHFQQDRGKVIIRLIS